MLMYQTYGDIVGNHGYWVNKGSYTDTTWLLRICVTHIRETYRPTSISSDGIGQPLMAQMMPAPLGPQPPTRNLWVGLPDVKMPLVIP